MQRIGDWIEVLSGQKFYPLDPRAGEMRLRDMAHAISREPRWGCHTEILYTVGMHSVQAAWMAQAYGYSPYVQFLCLTHDFHEAYLRDIPRPVKRMMPEYKAACDRIDSVLWYEYFGLRKPTNDELQELHFVDNALCEAEAIELGVNKTEWVEMPEGAKLLAGDYVWKAEQKSHDVRCTLEAMVDNILKHIRSEDVGPGVYQIQRRGA